jgi:hypothetical protein
MWFDETPREQRCRRVSFICLSLGIVYHISTPQASSPNGIGQFILTELLPAKDARTMAAHSPPQVDLTVRDDEVKRRNGFPTLSSLLLYVFVVCDDNVASVLKRASPLTWFENTADVRGLLCGI